MTNNKVIDLNRDIVAKCRCGGQLWYICVDKPDFEIIKGFECSFCGEVIEIHLTSRSSGQEKICAMWRDCKFVNTKECGNHCEGYIPAA